VNPDSSARMARVRDAQRGADSFEERKCVEKRPNFVGDVSSSELAHGASITR